MTNPCGPEEYRFLNFITNEYECKTCPPLPIPDDGGLVVGLDGRPINDEESLRKYLQSQANSTDPVTRQQYGDVLPNYEQCSIYQTINSQSILTPRSIQIARDAAQSEIIVDTGSWEVLAKADQAVLDNCGNSGNDIKEVNIRICEILNYYKNSDQLYLEEPYLSKEIRRQFGTADQLATSGNIEYVLPNLPEGYGPLSGLNTIDAYKKAIHSKRGFFIANNPTIVSYLNLSNLPSPDHIIMEEIYDFWIVLNRPGTKRPSDIDGIDFQALFSGEASSTEFEICMNRIFDDRLYNKYKDTDIQERIQNITSLEQLQDSDVDYIEDKLKVISTMEEDDAVECMNIINMGQMICQTGISEKMLKMGYLVFHIIGLDKMDLNNIQPGDQKYYKLTTILDRLTPYIREAVKKIIKISKHYELKTCGYESTTTHILETIYIDVFEKTKEVDIHIDSLDFIPTYLIKDTNMMEFARTIILLIVMISGIYVLLMVLNRPPYPVST